VQPDSQGDEAGHLQGRALPPGPAAPAAQRGKDQGSSHHSQKHQGRALERSGDQARCLHGFHQRVHAQKDQQPDGEAEEKIDPATIHRTHEGQPQQPDKHRDDPRIDPEEGKGGEITSINRGR
jgi:hypothetical protein